MYSSSTKTLSRIARLASSGLLAIALLSSPRPAQAVVSPSSGEYEFTVYLDANCEGDTASLSDSASGKTLQVANLALYSDQVSSWSFCNSTSQTAVALVILYTGFSYTGTSTIQTVTVPSGQCKAKAQITNDNSVASFSVFVYLK